MGFFEKLGRGLAKTRDAIFGSIGEMEKADRIDEDTYEELLEQLVLADTGLATRKSWSNSCASGSSERSCAPAPRRWVRSRSCWSRPSRPSGRLTRRASRR